MNEISIVHRREYNCESKCKVHSPIEAQQVFSLSVNNFSESTEVFPLLQLSVHVYRLLLLIDMYVSTI